METRSYKKGILEAIDKNSISRINATGGVTAPAGFVAGAASGGIRRKGLRDVGLLLSERVGTTAAAVYTQNVVQAAPVLVAREVVEAGGVRALVVNSGNANAATGERGMRDAREMQRLAAGELGLEPRQVVVASTGVIGEYLPMERVAAGIRAAAGGLGRDGSAFAEAILTTDTCTKEAAGRVEVAGATVTVGGVAKGSGMIHPNLATMLGFLTTDAAVERECLQETVRRAADRTFNRVTVDGDTSTNDMVLVLANGAAENRPLNLDSPDYPAFYETVEDVMRELAKKIARDGEGATRLVEVVVEGAADEEAAAALAKSVAGSSLVKAAVFGEDANWGRVLCALGYAGVPFDPETASIAFGPVAVFEGGAPVPHDVEEANATLRGDEVKITVRVGSGEGSAAAWGCDLTYEYVRINGDYRT
jgi:glutamate N-acetyltransferase/amino-acid N-acetyltransferase